MISRSIILLTVILTSSITFSDDNGQHNGDPINLETMIWLEREGMLDPEVPNSKVHLILKHALTHDDAKLFNCAIGIIGVSIGAASEARIQGKVPQLDRQLNELPKHVPELYDLLTNMWEKGWNESGGELPEMVPPPMDVFTNKTDCLFVPANPEVLWLGTPQILAHIFPGDDKVYDILWTHLPKVSDGSLLYGLFEGKFNKPKDQQHRIDVLLNRDHDMSSYWTSLAAKSLGEFPADQGVETLVHVLQQDRRTYAPPILEIVEAVMKYGEEAVPHIPLIRDSLESFRTIGRTQRELKAALQERLIHFEQEFGKYAEEVEPSVR